MDTEEVTVTATQNINCNINQLIENIIIIIIIILILFNRYYSTLRGCNMWTYFATSNNKNHKVLPKFLKNTSDSNPHRLNVLMCFSEPIFNPCYENRSHIFQNSLLIILIFICNKTDAFISPTALTMCFFTLRLLHNN